VRFSKQVWPGDTLTCTATVTGLKDEGDHGVAECEIKVTNQKGDTCLTGAAAARVEKAG
jgi:acyl dehydratase